MAGPELAAIELKPELESVLWERAEALGTGPFRSDDIFKSAMAPSIRVGQAEGWPENWKTWAISSSSELDGTVVPGEIEKAG